MIKSGIADEWNDELDLFSPYSSELLLDDIVRFVFDLPASSENRDVQNREVDERQLLVAMMGSFDGKLLVHHESEVFWKVEESEGLIGHLAS